MVDQSCAVVMKSLQHLDFFALGSCIVVRTEPWCRAKPFPSPSTVPAISLEYIPYIVYHQFELGLKQPRHCSSQLCTKVTFSVMVSQSKSKLVLPNAWKTDRNSIYLKKNGTSFVFLMNLKHLNWVNKSIMELELQNFSLICISIVFSCMFASHIWGTMPILQ